MSTGILSSHGPLLHGVTDSMGLAPVSQMARLPGVHAVYRVVVRYHNGRFCDAAATLRRSLVEGAALEIMFRGALGNKPLAYPVTPDRYNGFVQALHALRFDQLADQSGLPSFGVDLWLIERAAGTFVKSVILSPERAEGAYTSLVGAVQKYLPEALREVR